MGILPMPRSPRGFIDMTDLQQFLAEHGHLTRRYFLRLGSCGAAAVGIAGAGAWSQLARGEAPPAV